ncbi:MAG: sulfur-oxidizing protein SoxX [Arenicella sp.]|jgi:sulfur-oxidizing protein SoxX
MKLLCTGVLVVLTLLSAACDQETIANRGFYLPQGDTENGELLFTQYKCFNCHTMAGTDFVADEWRLTEDDGIAVEIGGATDRVQTYGDLVSSIINPSHRIAQGYSPEEVMEDNGESRMAYYNSVMTVEELIDIVTFLESKYELKRDFETKYPNYEYKIN